MADPTAPQRFIPFRRRDVVEMLVDDGRLAGDEPDEFRAFAELLSAVFHHDFRVRLEDLKNAYAPFDPDPDTIVVRRRDESERTDARRRLYDGLRDLLDKGNFEPIDEADVAAAFEDESLLRLRLEVDRDDFAEVLFFRRGCTTRTETVSRWFGLREREVTFTNYEKVLVLVTFQDAEHFADHDLDDLEIEPGSTILKLFQDVPRADLEMLFPNALPRMRRFDKVMIGVPAVVSGIIILATKLLTALGLAALLLAFALGLRDDPVDLDQATLVTLAAGLASLGGYLTRQVTKFRSRKLEFMKVLADHLYFRNLDNDMGVIHHLVDDAEEEEVKEAMLAWYGLRVADEPLTADQLDAWVEAWFADVHDVRMDFEVADGLAKLWDLDLVEGAGDGHLRAVPLEESMRRLDQRWDHYFTYANRARP